MTVAERQRPVTWAFGLGARGMWMDAGASFADLQRLLVGRPIQFFRLAADTLLLYIDCEPGQEGGYVLWVEPTWHFSGPEGVLVGSRQAQGEGDAGASREELRRIGAPLNRLFRLPITRLERDERTGDLTVAVGGELLVRTFVSDPSDDDLWSIRDRGRGVEVRGTTSGLVVSGPMADPGAAADRAGSG
jgi:hypothetical protein